MGRATDRCRQSQTMGAWDARGRLDGPGEAKGDDETSMALGGTLSVHASRGKRAMNGPISPSNIRVSLLLVRHN